MVTKFDLSRIDPLKVWKDARELLAKGWCQGHYADNRYGYPVEWTSPNAERFCLSGAIRRALLNTAVPVEVIYAYGKAWDVFFEPVAEYLGSPIGSWNDAHNQTQVVAMMDNFISYAQLEAYANPADQDLT